MIGLNASELEHYLKSAGRSSVHIRSMKVLGDTGKQELKAYGYGTPILIDYDDGETPRRAVLHTVSAGPFGHEHMSDRAQALLWDHDSFNRLPRHLRSINVGAFLRDGRAVSLGDAEEFFVLTEYGEGNPYVEDLVRLRAGSVTDTDLARTDALCDYLVDIHAVRGGEPGLYVRRIRELVGHSECIMGLIDSYPVCGDAFDGDVLQDIEHHCVQWRWRLKDRVHRLRQVHGDFHPWNILFREGPDFTLLDRSRGEWGDAADDVTCLTMNYVFFSLQQSGRLDGNMELLFRRFWERYLKKSGDTEMLQVAAPFLVFRGLVMAHPVWYPTLATGVRRKLFNFIQVVLKEDAFDPAEVNRYCDG